MCSYVILCVRIIVMCELLLNVGDNNEGIADEIDNHS